MVGRDDALAPKLGGGGEGNGRGGFDVKSLEAGEAPDAIADLFLGDGGGSSAGRPQSVQDFSDPGRITDRDAAGDGGSE